MKKLLVTLCVSFLHIRAHKDDKNTRITRNTEGVWNMRFSCSDGGGWNMRFPCSVGVLERACKFKMLKIEAWGAMGGIKINENPVQ